MYDTLKEKWLAETDSYYFEGKYYDNLKDCNEAIKKSEKEKEKKEVKK